MEILGIPFCTTDWASVPRTEHPGETGKAYWKTCNFGNLRVRMIEYTAGYLADHWCVKGHILLCTEGVLETEVADGRVFTLTPGMSYQVFDNAETASLQNADGGQTFRRRMRVLPLIRDGAKRDRSALYGCSA